jgi:hypothetical protein
MTKISIAVVAAFSLAAFGCKKKSADCDSAINNMMEVSKADLSKVPGMDDKMMDKMKGIAMQHCKDDKWPEDALKCMKEAKSNADAKKCQGMLPKELDKKMMDDVANSMGMGGGGGPPPEGSGGGAAPPAGGGSAEGSAPAAGGGGDLPKECADYKAVIDKLASCDKMQAAQRDAYKQAYDQASKGWASLPAEAKANVATACKTAADTVTAAAKTVCGW